MPERRAPRSTAARSRWTARPVSIHSPADARALGIETVYQDLALFDNLRPSDNFYAGRELAAPRWLPRSIRVLKRREMAATTRSTLERLQVTLDDHGAVGLMSGGQRQAVAVSRAAAFASSVVILDEPTAALGVRESRRVLDLILRLRDEQKAVDRRLARDGPRDRGCGPGGDHAAGPQGRRGDPERRDALRRSSR